MEGKTKVKWYQKEGYIDGYVSHKGNLWAIIIVDNKIKFELAEDNPVLTIIGN